MSRDYTKNTYGACCHAATKGKKGIEGHREEQVMSTIVNVEKVIFKNYFAIILTITITNNLFRHMVQ